MDDFLYNIDMFKFAPLLMINGNELLSTTISRICTLVFFIFIIVTLSHQANRVFKYEKYDLKAKNLKLNFSEVEKINVTNSMYAFAFKSQTDYDNFQKYFMAV